MKSGTMGRMLGTTGRKAKKSYTLSPETIAFLETLREKRRADSVSAVLEEILQAARRAAERASVECAVSDYYSRLSDREVNEHALWGEFALSQFPGEERD